MTQGVGATFTVSPGDVGDEVVGQGVGAEVVGYGVGAKVVEAGVESDVGVGSGTELSAVRLFRLRSTILWIPQPAKAPCQPAARPPNANAVLPGFFLIHFRKRFFRASTGEVITARSRKSKKSFIGKNQLKMTCEKNQSAVVT